MSYPSFRTNRFCSHATHSLPDEDDYEDEDEDEYDSQEDEYDDEDEMVSFFDL